MSVKKKFQAVERLSKKKQNSSPTEILIAVNKLYNSLAKQQKNCLKATLPHMSTLIKLLNYQLNQNIGKDDSQLAQLIRKQSLSCLLWIRYYGNEYMHEQLLNSRLVGALLQSISQVGGSNQTKQDYKFIYESLFEYIITVQKGRQFNLQYPDMQKLYPQPILMKEICEQIEEQAGNEEIESYLKLNGKVLISVLLSLEQVRNVYKTILNQYIDPSNQQRRL